MLAKYKGDATAAEYLLRLAQTICRDDIFHVEKYHLSCGLESFPLPSTQPALTSSDASGDGSTNTNRNMGVQSQKPQDAIGFRRNFAPKPTLLDATRIASLFRGKNSTHEYQVTTYMKGSPMSIYYISNDSRLNGRGHMRYSKALPNGRMGVCSRTLDLREDSVQHPIHWEVVKQLDLLDKLNELNVSLVIHGVLCEDSICNNAEGLPAGQHIFFAYSAVSLDAPNDPWLGGDRGKLISVNEMTLKLFQLLDLEHVPLHTAKVKLPEIAKSMDDLVKMGIGKGWFADNRAELVQTRRAFKVMAPQGAD
ncbi:hypothetical protein BD289DRAFT_450088 [Coniella lustricola]|uniref:RNA ligase domain-containing protein n=1 Tax=Coniella lustricola TaxID=2025994 RepID=A0A2T3AK68_9PEZI|nr:hypothetical protein BD289DRAFT_450088 [Coniella lustricola]